MVSLYTIYRIGYEGMVFLRAVHSFTHSLAYAIFQNSPQCTNQHYTLCKNTVCSLFCSLYYTHGNNIVSLLRASAGNVSLPGNLFGIQMDSVSLELPHLKSRFLMGFCNQITNENLPDLFVCHFTTTCFMEQEGIEDGHIN